MFSPSRIVGALMRVYGNDSVEPTTEEQRIADKIVDIIDEVCSSFVSGLQIVTGMVGAPGHLVCDCARDRQGSGVSDVFRRGAAGREAFDAAWAPALLAC